ncbi:hypothetical protein FE257_012315 [Aspergillus nanangensis]|uniref:Uncharacterized protein n=1 Tax=Aspergillus nanangensis TaxID=2582783 RepID=A0AAD4CHD8_ASPNN|nr:hypothetical protein FE257_012315 [Aspergillus nanangensis]
MQQQLLATFRSFFAKSSIVKQESPGWMTLLVDPQIDAAKEWRLRLRHPALAAALALHSRRSGSPGGEVQARVWYDQGLKQQQKILSCPGSSIKPGVEEVSAAILLAYYEVISSTSGMGYFQHVLGAQALLSLIGPNSCQDGNLHQLYQTVRLHMVYVSISTRTASILGTRDWTTIPFQTTSKTACDYMVDFLLRFPPALLQQNHPDRLSREAEAEMTSYLVLIWDMLFPSHNLEHAPTARYATHGDAGHEYTYLLTYIPVYPPRVDLDSVIAVALYSLGWVLVLSHGARQSFNKPEYTRLLTAHYGIILRAAVHMEELDDGCGYIRMVFPLRGRVQIIAFSYGPPKRDCPVFFIL